MNNLNLIFLEEYKQLDKLCSERYEGQPGVTNYINDMKSVDWNDAREISNWKSDLSNLKHLRHIRNHLAHTEGAFDEKLCTKEDVNWVKDFRNRILKQSDPLALYGKKSNIKKRNGANPCLVVSVLLVIITVIYLLIKMML